MNWRKPLIFALLYADRSRIPSILKQIKKEEFSNRDKLQHLQQQRLIKLLLHSYNNVPYYNTILRESEVVIDGKINLRNFSRIPLLTKKIIRNEGTNLYSKDYKSRKTYENTSGGSTGEPVCFIQDREYDHWNIATKLYFFDMLGKRIGEGEIKFWGSDRDILEGNLTTKDRLINFLYNRKFFNSYRLGKEHIQQLVALNNSFKPVGYWSYMESAFELAKYLKEHNIEFYPPKVVVSTIGPLTEQVKETIEAGMECKVYNQYGSREVGVVACQCKEQKGLHTFPWYNYVEILDGKNQPIEQGEGRLIVTTLQNFSMPLIRYEIGDVAVAGGYECSCGRNSFILDKVLGRTLGYFRKSDSSLVHSHFLVQALFFREWIKRFQIIQDRLGHILIKVQLKEDKEAPKEDLDDITRKTKVLMGNDCQIDFEFVDDIGRTQSGKFLYTVCNVNN
jgi:phenylacetate-CoA ligase